MRPPEARQISMARSSAQSEFGELSTGTKTSLYGMTPPSAVLGSQNDSELQGSATIRVGDARIHPRINNSRSLCSRESLSGVARAMRALLLLSPAKSQHFSLPRRAKARRARYEPWRNACQGT